MSGFVEYIQEVLQPFGPVEARRMFGGYGVYHRGLMFALIVDDMFYLKADAGTARHFIEKGCGQFEYHKRGKPVKLSYYLAPEEVYEDPEEAIRWAARAYEAACRARRDT